MEIELKRIGYNPRLGIDAFAANLMINGKKAALVSNKGNGTEYYPVSDEGLELVQKVEAFLKKLPEEKRMVDGKEQIVRNNLAGLIDKLFLGYLTDIEKKKFDKKVDLMMKQNIVIGQPGNYMRTYLMKTPIEMLLKGKGADLIVDTIYNRVLPEMAPNEVILNTNIPAELLKKAGLKDEQIINSVSGKHVKKEIKQNKGKKL